MVATAPRREYRELKYAARGGAVELFAARDREILIEGPAGTGKTRSVLELIHLLCMEYPELYVLIVRKVAKSLTGSVLRTYRRDVVHRADGVRFRSSTEDRPAAYLYPNGSQIVVGGMNDTGKILSTEYDLIYASEVLGTDTDPAFTLEEYETLIPRLRPPGAEFAIRHYKTGKLFTARRIISDANPSHEKHWLYQREATLNPLTGKPYLRVIKSFPQDNPAYFNEDGSMTEQGAEYIGNLNATTGTRYQRYRLGLRVGVQNAVYPMFSRQVHVRTLEKRDGKTWESVADGWQEIIWKTGAIGEDQGKIHSAGVVTVKTDQYGRRWVVEAWGEPDPEEGEATAREAGRQGLVHNVKRYRTDPVAAKVALATARLLGKDGIVNASEGSPGARLARIRMIIRLLAIFPGGRVMKGIQDHIPNFPGTRRPVEQWGPYAEPDSPGLLFVRDAPGIERLCGQMESLHYQPIETSTKSDRVLARIDDDLEAPLGYAVEELESDMLQYSPPPTYDLQYGPRRPAPQSGPQRLTLDAPTPRGPKVLGGGMR